MPVELLNTSSCWGVLKTVVVESGGGGCCVVLCICAELVRVASGCVSPCVQLATSACYAAFPSFAAPHPKTPRMNER